MVENSDPIGPILSRFNSNGYLFGRISKLVGRMRVPAGWCEISRGMVLGIPDSRRTVPSDRDSRAVLGSGLVARWMLSLPWARMTRAIRRRTMVEPITRILVPVDFSPPSDRAFRYAARLASRFGAAMELVHVVDDPLASGAWTAEVYVPNMPEVLDNLLREAEKRLTTMKLEAANQGVHAEIHVLTGQPAHAIVEHAGTGGFDLIVMGTHGRTGFSHLFVGSVAERVIRTAPCPVLTVRDIIRPAEEAEPIAARAAA
jgi:nucleotide-binding universal stress UspA family protein